MFSSKPNKRRKRLQQRFERKPGYEQRNQAQLVAWAAGQSVHNKIDDECCPDFSCCHPHLKADDETRQRYFKADRDEQEIMLGGFLEALVNLEAPRAAVLGANASWGKCEECGAEGEELRPYGTGGKKICFGCVEKNPEEAERQMAKHMGWNG